MSDDAAATPRTRLAERAPWPRAAGAAPGLPKRRSPIDSEALFAGAEEIEIAHRGVLYRLRRTALGKLILTK